MIVDIKYPIIAGDNLELDVTLVNSFSQEPIGTLVVISSGLYNMENKTLIDRYCDTYNNNTINIPIEFGKEITHKLSCKIPDCVTSEEAVVMVKTGYTTNIGSLNGDDYNLIDQRFYPFDIESKGNVSSVIAFIIGLFFASIVK